MTAVDRSNRRDRDPHGEAGELPLSSGMTSPTALAAPVLVGITLTAAASKPVQVFVNLVGQTRALVVGVGVDRGHEAFLDAEGLVQHLHHGARQFVVQEALEMMSWLSRVVGGRRS